MATLTACVWWRNRTPVGCQGTGRADCGVCVRSEAPYQRCTDRGRGAIGAVLGRGEQGLEVNLGNLEAIGMLTEGLPTPEKRNIGFIAGRVRRYHGAVRPGTVPGHRPTGKSYVRGWRHNQGKSVWRIAPLASIMIRGSCGSQRLDREVRRMEYDTSKSGRASPDGVCH